MLEADDPELDVRLRELVSEHDVERIVVGLPVSLSGEEGASADRARAFAAFTAKATEVPVDLVDERFTTKTAEGALIAGRVRRSKRREVVDKVAAAVMLGHYLDGRR